MASDLDPGLDELISDQLGPADPGTDLANASDVPVEQSAAPPEEQNHVQQAQPQSNATETQSQQAAPTAAAPELVEINGRQYTREQLAAALTTREQFPHLQGKYTALLEAQRAAEAQRQAQPQQGQPLDNAGVKAQIRASFDGSVKRAVADGFIEEDFAILYPDLAASMIMNRDALLAVANKQHEVNEKIARYEGQIEADRVRSEIENNMVALSGQHQAFAPLADQTTRQQFFGYLVNLNPQMSHLRNPDFMAAQWVAFNKNQYLGGVQKMQAQQAANTAQRQVARQRAAGDALTGSRPSAVAPTVKTALDEMVEDFLAYNA